VNDRAGWTADGRPLLAGAARGRLLVLDAPLSLWGGLDPASGEIVDLHHPQAGARLRGMVVALPAGRGSSSSSSVLAEAIRTGNGPRALLLADPDGILLIGALVARELTGRSCPVLVLRAADYRRLRSGAQVAISAAGHIQVRPVSRPSATPRPRSSPRRAGCRRAGSA
jgi:predicted aconitase with swiveling domain